MNKLKLLLLLAAILVCAGSSCPSKIKTASFLVHPTDVSYTGISDGGVVKWIASFDDSNAFASKQFKVHIYPTDASPCVGGINDIVGTAIKPAVCVISADADGFYKYSILNDGDSPYAVGLQENPFVIDHCTPLCSKVMIKNNRNKHPDLPQSRVVNPPVIAIDCEQGQTATADPASLSVYAGQIVTWSQLGPDHTTDWQTDQLAPVCQEGNGEFGTINPTDPMACTVKADAPLGALTYKLTYKNSAKTCTGTATLTVVPAPKPR